MFRLRRFQYVQIAYAVFLTLLLWLPDPRRLLWGLQAGESAEGYVHAITFSLLGFLVELGRREKSVFFWATMLILYAFTTEIVQHFLPIRAFEIADILQDFSGIFIGFWCATACRFYLPASLHKNENENMMKKTKPTSRDPRSRRKKR